MADQPQLDETFCALGLSSLARMLLSSRASLGTTISCGSLLRQDVAAGRANFEVAEWRVSRKSQGA